MSVFLGFLCFLLNRLISRTLSLMRVGVRSASVHNGSSLCIADRTSLLNIRLKGYMTANGKDMRAKRILTTISVVSGLAAGLASYAFGVGIASVLLFSIFLLSGWFALATPQQIADLLEKLSD